MAEHPIQNLMNVTMDKIRQMVDSNTIVGKPITTDDGTTIQLSDGNNTVDRALTMIPELVEKVSALIKKDEPAAPKSEQ